ncbi:MAG: sigma-70 family RNA polymerase sigma factor [Blastocatellia bacterium]|nr:sigma-70 family RNA polymerase sigma factor [Blastocatellia bacterium]
MTIPSEIYQSEHKFLWGLCYRMTANAADAEDIVQETFVRAMERPPRNTAEPWRPWLTSVALNLSRDHLRWRRRREYKGTWLPTPIPTDQAEVEIYEIPQVEIVASPAARYDLLESISLAFLIALEALTPMQRAVLLLRDVFDYSTQETAELLQTSEANVKVVLHRARKVMERYDRQRIRLSQHRQSVTQQALQQFVFYLSTHDTAGLERLLTADIVNLSDGGGEVAAAFAPIRGRDRVLRLFFVQGAKQTSPPRVSFRMINGLPALLVERDDGKPKFAKRFVIQCEVNPQGQIHQINTFLAPSKLKAIWG